MRFRNETRRLWKASDKQSRLLAIRQRPPAKTVTPTLSFNVSQLTKWNDNYTHKNRGRKNSPSHNFSLPGMWGRENEHGGGGNGDKEGRKGGRGGRDGKKYERPGVNKKKKNWQERTLTQVLRKKGINGINRVGKEEPRRKNVTESGDSSFLINHMAKQQEL